MPSRRPHPKSRHGCAQCKAAHVKCDLCRPVCGRCKRWRKSCEFGPQLDSRSLDTPAITPAATPGHHGLDTQSPGLTIVAVPSQRAASDPLELSPLTDTVPWDDLGLLHHYLTVTYRTMANRDDLTRIWQIEVPKLAMKHRFLMNGLFSIAALHIAASAEVGNRTSYVDIAIQHYNNAIREYSARLNGINKENNAAVFLCATLIAVFALNLGTMRSHSELKGPVDEILGIFILLRGVGLVLTEVRPWITKGEVAAMFQGRDIDPTLMLSDDITDALRQLEDRIKLGSNGDCSKEVYFLSIQLLKDCFKRVSVRGMENGMIFSWPILVEQAYIKRLASRQPMALVILAYYAVVLDEIKDVWWASGWGIPLVREIGQILDDDWKTLIVWPMKKVGVIESE